MTRIKNKPSVIEGNQQYFAHDEKEDRIYCRVEASIIFPGSSPGIVCIAAEEMRKYYSGQEGPIYLLAEHEEWDMGKLLRKYLELKAEFKITSCIAPPSETSTRFLQTFNAQQRKDHLEEVYLDWPPNYQEGVIDYHVQILKEVLRNESRRLHIPEGSAIPGYLQQMPLGEKFKDSDYPLVAGLSYIITKFITQPYVAPSMVEHTVEIEYDVFKSYGLRR